MLLYGRLNWLSICSIIVVVCHSVGITVRSIDIASKLGQLCMTDTPSDRLGFLPMI